MPNSRRHLAWRHTLWLGSPLLLAGLLVGLAQAGLVPAAAIPGIAGAMTSCQNWTGLRQLTRGFSGPGSSGPGTDGPGSSGPGTEGNELLMNAGPSSVERVSADLVLRLC